MFQVMVLMGSILAFIIGGLIVLMGIGAITGCAGGLIALCVGGFLAFIGAWSTISFLMPSTEKFQPASVSTVTLVRKDGKWM